MPHEQSFSPVVAVTGGAGFIGSNLLLRLARTCSAAKLVCIDALTYAGDRSRLAALEGHEQFAFAHVSTTEIAEIRAAVNSHDVDVILHLAAESHVDRSIDSPAPFVMSNLVGTANMLSIARELHEGGRLRKFIHMSTDEVFGPSHTDRSTTLADRYVPSSPYAATKAGSDHLVESYARTYGLPVCVVHASNCYGPRQYPEKMIPVAIKALAHGEAVPVYGDGKHERDWLFVEDLCRGLELIVQREGVLGRFAFSTGVRRTNEQLVLTLARIISQRTQIAVSNPIRFVADRPGHDRSYSLFDQHTRDLLGWAPAVDFESGLAATVDWYLEQFAATSGSNLRESS